MNNQLKCTELCACWSDEELLCENYDVETAAADSEKHDEEEEDAFENI